MKKTEFPYQQIVGPDIIWLMISKTEILFTTEFFYVKLIINIQKNTARLGKLGLTQLSGFNPISENQKVSQT